MDISIVIPVWNESAKIVGDLDAAVHFLTDSHMSGELIVSDDGSTDDTMEVVETYKTGSNLSVRFIKNKHQGKGNAVRSGILQAMGDIVLYIDSGNCIPYKDVGKGIRLIREDNCDISHASRFLPESRIVIQKNWARRISSYLFRRFVHLNMNIPDHLTDTQCGLKIYKKGIAHQLYRSCFTRGFIFDIEIILRAKQQGLEICEFPVRWSSDPDSRLSLFRSLPQISKELIRIKKEF